MKWESFESNLKLGVEGKKMNYSRIAVILFFLALWLGYSFQKGAEYRRTRDCGCAYRQAKGHQRAQRNGR